MPLTTFAAAVAVALSLMFVAVLLAAGSLALERSENTFERLVRGPLTRTGLLAEKIVLAAPVLVRRHAPDAPRARAVHSRWSGTGSRSGCSA